MSFYLVPVSHEGPMSVGSEEDARILRGREMLFGTLYEYARERGLLPKREKGSQG